MHTTLSVLSDLAAAVPPLIAAPKTINEVISGITGWIMGIIALVATMFLVIGGLRYMAAGGDPAQVEQAKGNFKSALIGYALAVLSPVVLGVLAEIVGGPKSVFERAG
jgi:beta-lactamase regulating signal transducer with metallopeptidase domain